MKKVNVLLTLLFLSIAYGFAQSPDNRWGIGVYGGANQYSGDFGNGFYRFNQSFYGFGGLSVARNLSEHWDLEFNTSYGEIGHIENLDYGQNRFLHEMFQFNFVAKYSFFKYDNVRLRPFVFAGMGYANFDDKLSTRNYDNFIVPVGAGLTYKVSPRISVVIKETFMFPDGDNIELANSGPSDAYLQHSVGIVFNLGRKKDRDKDGISDRRDKCPDLFGVRANNGCPPDGDGDGVYDADDRCPDQSGSVALKGCPDRDGDGVADIDDACPDEKGSIATNGCPDKDGDGVADKDDACPNEKGTKALQGCPDRDGDGIADKDDACPNEKGTKALQGCPDRDGDGIADKDDACPDKFGVKANNGCPEEETLDRDLYHIDFMTGKSDIHPRSYKVLDKLAGHLVNSPKASLSIEGHTDSTGSDAINTKISQLRADAVKSYLVTKHKISPKRISAVGKGSLEPIDTNATSAGRAKNRRVDLIISK